MRGTSTNVNVNHPDKYIPLGSVKPRGKECREIMLDIQLTGENIDLTVSNNIDRIINSILLTKLWAALGKKRMDLLMIIKAIKSQIVKKHL